VLEKKKGDYMKKKTGIDPSYYENNCFADEFREADRKGELLRPHDGKNAIEVMREHIAAKKRFSVAHYIGHLAIMSEKYNNAACLLNDVYVAGNISKKICLMYKYIIASEHNAIQKPTQEKTYLAIAE